MEQLKENYKNDVYVGNRRYTMITNDDGTISLVDVTTYTEEGDDFGASDINATNKAINDLMQMIKDNKFTENLTANGEYLTDENGDKLLADWKYKVL